MAITVTHGKDSQTAYADAKKWVIDPDGRLHIVGEAGNLASYNEGYWANVGHMDSVKAPEGYEFQEVSHAKNHAMDALEAELEKQGIELYEDGSPELIELADAVVEALLKSGVVIPEGITNPHGAKNP